MMQQLGVIKTKEGIKINLMRHVALDEWGIVPQAVAWQKGKKFYVFVGIGFLSAPKEVQDWILCHEIGHIKLGHTRSWLKTFVFNQIRKRVPFKPVMEREMAADRVANEMTGSANGGILFFNFLERIGVEMSVENKKRLAACVAYNERFAK